MSSTMKFTSQAPLLISCPLPLATITQPSAGSFRERAATPFSIPQLCPPDFPMPDIRKRQCAEPIDLHAFAPVLAYHLLRLEQTPDLRSFPAEIVPGQLRKWAAAMPNSSPNGSQTAVGCRDASLRLVVERGRLPVLTRAVQRRDARMRLYTNFAIQPSRQAARPIMTAIQ